MIPLFSINRALGAKEEDALIMRSTRGARGAPRDTTTNPVGLGGRLASRFKGSKSAGGRPPLSRHPQPAYGADPRQRAIVKIHYFKHSGGGGAALRAHGSYIEREGALLEKANEPHAQYLSRDGREGFYGPDGATVDGRAQLADWAKADARHFRIILSPENAQAIGDLTGYTCEVMKRAEAELGRPLQWVAVNQWDTDNPHTHIVLRGRDGYGIPLGLPDNFIKHDLREFARDVASEWLGPRTPDDERRTLDREVRAQRLTRLDRLIEIRLNDQRIARMADLATGIKDPGMAAAVKARAVVLARMGLAEEGRRGEFTFSVAWKERLKAIEEHVDIRRRVLKERAAERQPGRNGKAFERAAEALSKQTGKPNLGLGDTTQPWKVRDEVDLPSGRYLALERHDRVALAPKPPGLDIVAGQKAMVGMRGGVATVTRAIGIER